MNWLKNHPFSVQAYFKESFVLSYAVPIKELEHLIPAPLTIDTFKDQYGFVAVALVQTKNLRPAGFPKFLGQNFFLVGYRVFVRYTTQSGKKLRGLYILGSQTDKSRMRIAGNIFTHYNYKSLDIDFISTGTKNTFSSNSENLNISYDEIQDPKLPPHSPFENWKEARKFSGPLPYTFTYSEKENSMLMIKGIRTNWKPLPVQVEAAQVEFITTLGIKNYTLANAFVVRDIPYKWEKGIKEILS